MRENARQGIAAAHKQQKTTRAIWNAWWSCHQLPGGCGLRTLWTEGLDR